VAKRKDKTGRISVFKGREAKLNRAIFQILALKNPLTIYDLTILIKRQRLLHRKLYSVVNRRVRALEQLGYLEKVGTRKTVAGFTATLYQLTPRAYLALILCKTDLDRFIEQAEDGNIVTVLGVFACS